VKAGARRDGTLTALQIDVLSNTGAYGNHGPGVLFHACGESVAVYNCPNKKIDGTVVYTNTVPSGAFRGYGLSQTNFAVESAMDALARGIGMDPFEFRRRNIVKPGDPLVSADSEAHDVEFGSYGLDQCLTLVEKALASDRPAPPVLPAGWRLGEGIAIGMLETTPPRGHFADVRIALRPDGGYDLIVGTAEFGNGTTTVHAQIAATILGTVPARIHIRQSDTDLIGHDTGAFGSTGTVVAGLATQRAAQALRDTLLAFALETGGARGEWMLDSDAAMRAGERIPLPAVFARAQAAGRELAAKGSAPGTPRSVAFNVQGFRVAVNIRTGEVRIVRSVHAADAGVVINPMQCRGQVEGGVAQAIGAALYEEVAIDATGSVVNPSFRQYHVPAFADLPRTEVHFANTADKLGPLGAKSMSESPYNPVAAALANAVADATGIRFRELPLRADRVHQAIMAKSGAV
jgi:CO/xanthine dehydrogenase Mo-binding subunit